MNKRGNKVDDLANAHSLKSVPLLLVHLFGGLGEDNLNEIVKRKIPSVLTGWRCIRPKE